MDKKTVILENVFEFLDRISNTVGDTITEYHWREAEELKLMITENFDVNYKMNTPKVPVDSDVKVYDSPAQIEDDWESFEPLTRELTDIPGNLDQAIANLKTSSPDVQLWANDEEESAVVTAHHSVGRNLRNDWNLWTGSQLSEYFNQLGIFHPDDMSTIILTSLHREINHKTIDLNGQIRHHRDY